MDNLENTQEPVEQQKVEQETYAYTPKEQELIRQLMEARKEQKSELLFENLDDYEVPPRTQFSMLKKPSVTFNFKTINFNCAAVRLFEGSRQILPMTSTPKKRFIAVPCDEEESASIEWARYKKESWVSKKITSELYVKGIYDMMKWRPECKYKALGRLAQSERGLILVFDLKEAIMFDPLPLEYIDKKTGKTKKRIITYLPDEYKDRIGKSYKDYIASHQMNMFEDLNEYSTEEDMKKSEQDVSTYSAYKGDNNNG